jgi:hypothetical protein
VASWWRQHPKANVGIVCGKVSNVTIVDVDKCGHSPDMPTRLQKLFGSTPLVVETPGGGYHLYYTHNGEKNGPWDWPEEGLHGDLRSNGGYIMAPGSLHPEAQATYRINGDLTGFLAGLEVLPGLLQNPTQSSVYKEDPLTFEGNRNNTLFKRAIKVAGEASSKEELSQQMEAFNQSFAAPLPLAEVSHAIENVWGYKQKGTLMKAGEPRAVITKPEWQRLGPDELYLLAFLRMGSGQRTEFAVGVWAVSQAMPIPWGVNRLRNALRGLLDAGIINMTYKGGRGARDASRYAWGDPLS